MLLDGMTLMDAMLLAQAVPGIKTGAFNQLGWVGFLLVILSAAALGIIVERLFHFHRAQINSSEFLSGVRNVLKSNNPVEAIAICDATPGPVARLMKSAILNRDHGRERLQEAIEELGLVEVPRLEDKLTTLATIGQIAPLAGLLGTLTGFIQVFRQLQDSTGFAAPANLFAGVGQGLYSSAAGITIAIVCYAAHNYLVTRVNAIVLDMERASGEAIRMVTPDSGNGNRRE